MILPLHGLTSSAATFPRLRGGARIRARLIGGEIVEGVVRVGLENSITLVNRYEVVYAADVEDMTIEEACGK